LLHPAEGRPGGDDRSPDPSRIGLAYRHLTPALSALSAQLKRRIALGSAAERLAASGLLVFVQSRSGYVQSIFDRGIVTLIVQKMAYDSFQNKFNK
jgi:hypothetical protein